MNLYTGRTSGAALAYSGHDGAGDGAGYGKNLATQGVLFTFCNTRGPSYTCMNLSPTGRTTGTGTTGATGRCALGDGAAYGKNLAPARTALSVYFYFPHACAVCVRA